MQPHPVAAHQPAGGQVEQHAIERTPDIAVARRDQHAVQGVELKVKLQRQAFGLSGHQRQRVIPVHGFTPLGFHACTVVQVPLGHVQVAAAQEVRLDGGHRHADRLGYVALRTRHPRPPGLRVTAVCHGYRRVAVEDHAAEQLDAVRCTGHSDDGFKVDHVLTPEKTSAKPRGAGWWLSPPDSIEKTG